MPRHTLLDKSVKWTVDKISREGCSILFSTNLDNKYWYIAEYIEGDVWIWGTFGKSRRSIKVIRIV